MRQNLPEFIIERIRDRGLRHAWDHYCVTAELYDRNGHFVSSYEMTAEGYAQQEEILQALENADVIPQMAEYYFLNWPKSLRLLLCELEDDNTPAQADGVRRLTLRLQEAQLCCCPE